MDLMRLRQDYYKFKNIRRLSYAAGPHCSLQLRQSQSDGNILNMCVHKPWYSTEYVALLSCNKSYQHKTYGNKISSHNLQNYKK